mmetsp:Transcript_14545/g.47402  ORF Transcript_14545/g.47402 Transcript_14545/m.47402 type:complete len:231 (-) Transcript_14545:318-1010(-)
MAPPLRGEEAVGAAKAVIRKSYARSGRPTTVQQLWENTKKVVAKAAIQQGLSDMVADGSLRQKAFGKTVVYYPPPAEADCDWTVDDFCRVIDEELPELEAAIARKARDAVKVAKRAEALAREPLNSELDDKPTGDGARDHDDARIKVLESRTFVPKETMRQAKVEYNAQLRRWRALRSAALGVVDLVEDSCDDDTLDLAHLAGVFDDTEAHLANATTTKDARDYAPFPTT